MACYQRARWHGDLDTVRGRAGSRIEERSGHYVMLSACCKSEVFQGDPHENGKQYCKKCDDPCLWKWGVLKEKKPKLSAS